MFLATALLLCTNDAVSQDVRTRGDARSAQLSQPREEDCSRACRERMKKLERQVRSLQREVRYLQEEVVDLRQMLAEDQAALASLSVEEPLVCDPPYVVDDGGIKRYRFECLENTEQAETADADCSTPFYFRRDGVKLMKVECL